MEHIVQFAIGIDDKAIQNRIEEHIGSSSLRRMRNEQSIQGLLAVLGAL